MGRGSSGGAGRIGRMGSDGGPVAVNSERKPGTKMAPPIPVNVQAAKDFKAKLTAAKAKSRTRGNA